MRTTENERLLRFDAIALTTIAILAGAGCANHQQAGPPPPYVKTAIARFGAIQPFEQLAGIIAPYENVAIQTTLTEPADSVFVQEGDHVARGQILAQLDTADLEAQLQADLALATGNHANTTHTVYQGSLAISQGVDNVRAAQASVQQAQANLERDQRDFSRDQALLTNGYVSQQLVQSQQTTVRDDEASLRSAQSALAIARSTVQANGSLGSSGMQASSVQQSAAQEQVALAQAQQIRVEISKATIVSPIDGVVVNRNLNPGEYPGTRQIFTLQQIATVFAVLHGSGSQVAEIATGARATISAADVANDPKLPGSVVGVLNQIVPGSTDFEVKVLMKNQRGALRPGMAVQGQVSLPVVRGIGIPTTAFTDDNHGTIDIVTADDTVKTIHVVEIADSGSTSIVSGVQSGTRVVSDGQTSVGDGEKVTVH
jgi:multidrug efflux pump subunit AcrA (membrane-fusion protein)